MIMSGSRDRERLVADDVARAPDRVPKPFGLHLADIADLSGRWAGRPTWRLQHRDLVLRLERGLQLHVMVEVVLHRALAAAGDQDEVLDPRRARASASTWWISGRSTTVSISLGTVLAAGSIRVPRPATGSTALRTRFINSPLDGRRGSSVSAAGYSTVTDLARLRG